MKEIGAQLGSGVKLGALVSIVMLGSAVMRNDYQASGTSSLRDPMVLIASPNDPYMIESIRLAKMPRAEDGPWGGAKRKQGPTATFETPGGALTLTRAEIADANHIYPQLVENSKIPSDS
jgi:hypothetical protein